MKTQLFSPWTFVGQTSGHLGPVSDSKQWHSGDGQEVPPEVCGAGNAPHAGPRTGCPRTSPL